MDANRDASDDADDGVVKEIKKKEERCINATP